MALFFWNWLLQRAKKREEVNFPKGNSEVLLSGRRGRDVGRAVIDAHYSWELTKSTDCGSNVVDKNFLNIRSMERRNTLGGEMVLKVFFPQLFTYLDTCLNAIQNDMSNGQGIFRTEASFNLCGMSWVQSGWLGPKHLPHLEDCLKFYDQKIICLFALEGLEVSGTYN